MGGGRFCRPRNTSMLSGRMSQTSNERLRDYLVQLPPQSQALLMREFERAIERGDDTTVAAIALEQLRKIVRGADEESAAAHRRSGAVAVPAARTVSGRKQCSGTARSDTALVAASGVAVAEPRRRAGAGARIRRDAGQDAGNRFLAGSRSGGPQAAARRGRCDLQNHRARRRQAARARPCRSSRGDRGPAADRLGAARPRSARHLQQQGAQLFAGFRRGADCFGRNRTQRSRAANAATAAVCAVADRPAADRAVANHPACDQDGLVRR